MLKDEGDSVCVTLGLASCDGVIVRVRPPEMVCEGEVLGVAEAEGVNVPDAVLLPEAVLDRVAVALAVDCCERDWVALCVAAAVPVAVALGVGACEGDCA